MKRSRLKKGSKKRSVRLKREPTGYTDRNYGKRVVKSEHVLVMVKIGKRWDSYGQSGVDGWTYQDVFQDSWDNQIPEALKDFIEDWKIVEE